MVPTYTHADVVRCLHPLIMEVNIMAIWAFDDFFEVSFFQGGLIVWHTSLMTLKARIGSKV